MHTSGHPVLHATHEPDFACANVSSFNLKLCSFTLRQRRTPSRLQRRHAQFSTTRLHHFEAPWLRPHGAIVYSHVSRA